jgi:photosystem II stability/assembly factor-like uncharacterized protein
MTRFAALSLVVFIAGAPASLAQFGSWNIQEFQPDIANGGRADTIAVNPANNDVILVASESGGLFRSADRGTTWSHVDSLPEFSTNAVAILPANTNIIIVATAEDFRVSNGGGIWRSTNGGSTWTQMPSPPAPPGAGRVSAYEISIAGDSGNIYVATEYGVSYSADQGATWTHVDPFGGGDRRVFSVLAQAGGRVLAAGPAGVRRSTDGGSTWAGSTTGTGGSNIWDIHALGGSPFYADQAYVVNGNTELWYTEDHGDHWTQITGAPGGGGGCGGITFVKAIGRVFHLPGPHPAIRRTVALYAGNRCGVSRLTTPQTGTTHFNYSGAWTALNTDHGDTRDLAFTSAHAPLLLATDGGLHKTADGGAHWTFAGGGHNGYNALQITEVKDQWITSLGRHDLYFGTQDNNLWASTNDGVSWSNPFCCEGFFLERLHRVPTVADGKITFVSCGACGDFVATPGFGGVANWPDVSTPPTANPKIVRQSWFVQGVATTGSFTKGFATTSTGGSTWSQYANVPEDFRDIAKLSDPGLLPVLYQAIRTGWDATDNFEINHLARVTKRLFSPGANVTYPLMNNFGGLGINPTMFAWYQVFGVDPGNTRHIIAPDIVNAKMMQTSDGGDNWSEIPGLTSQITGGGTFLFRRYMFPQASAVSFSPDDPHYVAIGTWQNGLFLSADRGATFTKVPGSELATYITSIEWKNASDAVVSTYGRGLWRMQWHIFLPPIIFETYCKVPCLLDPWDVLSDPAEKYTNTILVFNGQVQGARMSNGVLRELFVTPGSSVAFFSDAKEARDIKVTESAKNVGFGTNVSAPKAPAKRMLIGFALNAKGKVIRGVYTEKPLAMYEPTQQEREQDKEETGRKESPTAGKPYIELQLGSGGANTVGALKPFVIALHNFRAETALEIAIDDKVVEKGRANEKGEAVVRLVAPREAGLHSVTVRDAQTQKVIDGAMFIVKHEDERRERNPNVRPKP